MHIDLNAFFATAEELRHPELVGKPIVVGGYGPRGVVSTASYAARKYGIHSAMPGAQAKKLCPEAVFLEPDFGYYSMLSRSFFSYLKRYSLIIEEASIDEGYVDMTEATKGVKDAHQYFQGIMMGLLKEIGLKCSIGVAPTKFLAKMASDMKKPLGITFLYRKNLSQTLYPLPIDAFFGIGKKTAERMKEIGIKTIGDFKRATDVDDPKILSMLGKSYSTLKKEVNGTSSDTVDPTVYDAKSLGHSQTFPFDTNEEDTIKAKITELAIEATGGIRRDHKKGKTITLVIKDSDFKSHSKSLTLSEATDSSEMVTQTAIRLYESNFLGMMIRLVGVTISNLLDPHEETVQMSLWNYENYEEMDKTKLLVNELNRKLDKPALKLASEVKKNGDR